MNLEISPIEERIIAPLMKLTPEMVMIGELIIFIASVMLASTWSNCCVNSSICDIACWIYSKRIGLSIPTEAAASSLRYDGILFGVFNRLKT